MGLPGPPGGANEEAAALGHAGPEAGLAEEAGGFLRARLVRLLGQAEEAVEASVVLFDVLCLVLLAEGLLRLGETTLDKLEVALAGCVGCHLDVMLDLCHDIFVL